MNYILVAQLALITKTISVLFEVKFDIKSNI